MLGEYHSGSNYTSAAIQNLYSSDLEVAIRKHPGPTPTPSAGPPPVSDGNSNHWVEQSDTDIYYVAPSCGRTAGRFFLKKKYKYIFKSMSLISPLHLHIKCLYIYACVEYLIHNTRAITLESGSPRRGGHYPQHPSNPQWPPLLGANEGVPCTRNIRIVMPMLKSACTHCSFLMETCKIHGTNRVLEK